VIVEQTGSTSYSITVILSVTITIAILLVVVASFTICYCFRRQKFMRFVQRIKSRWNEASESYVTDMINQNGGFRCVDDIGAFERNAIPDGTVQVTERTDHPEDSTHTAELSNNEATSRYDTRTEANGLRSITPFRMASDVEEHAQMPLNRGTDSDA
jgi:hypothetical protein